ncbi:restriction endonuclease subunit S [Aliivibrio fischeri]|uniref:restriction endonuclease subunit S n=1 Tax=Aliivibrio fischeri TaxID=668 RepID=UPI00107E7D66|nr:restriction endonuclease subunit S [Aliivibrio fischeri]TGA73263.1 restriction endonuclease subunit S [Aliivibrio fischeri]
MVPNGWNLITLDELKSDKLSYGANSPSCELKENGARYIRITDIDDMGNLNSSAVGIDSDDYEDYLLEDKDFLFARSGNTVGKTFLYEKDKHPKAAYAGYLIRYRANKEKLNPQYLKQFCFSNRYHFWIKSQIRAGAQPNINAKEYGSLELPLPPLPEQRKIAQILSTWDRGIATTEKLIDASKQQKKALMQQLLTGKKRLVDPETGKVFEGEWEEVKLNDLALYRRGSFPQPYGNPEWVDEVNGYPFIQVFDIDKNMKLKKATKTKISDAAIDKSVFIEAGTVIVSLQGSIGRVAITQYDAYVDRTVLLFQSFKRKMDTIYFAYAIQELFEIEKEKAPGGTIKTITKQVLSNFTIKVPTHYEQQKIASVLTAADKDIELLEAKLAHLKQEKKALMQQLLTGKHRVSLSS